MLEKAGNGAVTRGAVLAELAAMFDHLAIAKSKRQCPWAWDQEARWPRLVARRQVCRRMKTEYAEHVRSLVFADLWPTIALQMMRAMLVAKAGREGGALDARSCADSPSPAIRAARAPRAAACLS